MVVYQDYFYCREGNLILPTKFLEQYYILQIWWSFEEYGFLASRIFLLYSVDISNPLI